MRRSEKEITDPDELAAIIKNNRICHLALADGNHPHIVPVNYGYADGSLYIHSALEGEKITVIRKNSRVAFEILDGFDIIAADRACHFATRYRCLIGTGTATILCDAHANRKALDIIMRHHTGKGGWTYDDASLQKMCIIKIAILEMKGKKSGRV
jgi:uncharacterized protein